MLTTKKAQARPAPFSSLPRQEMALGAGMATCLVFVLGGERTLPLLTNPGLLPYVAVWLFVVMLWSSLSVVRHAEDLARRLGEPYGTLLLTLSVTAIEVASISAVMVHGENNPVLVRDTLFAVIMIILNGMVGFSLLLGGWRHREQHYNLQGANAYLSVIIPLAVMSLIMPDFTLTTPGPTLSADQQLFLVVMALGLYGAFLGIQTGRHREYFSVEADGAGEADKAAGVPAPALPRSIALLVAYLVTVIYMAELLAHPIDYLIETLRAPAALGGVIIAVLVATPEALGAVRAAIANQLQRSVNIFLGSVLSTIGLTIPAMLIIGHFTGRHFDLGLQHTDIVMLLLTLFSSAVTFASGRTNVLQGAVHLLLFTAYVLLIFQD
jgi:Ca2+:H+ antiporter